MRSEPEPSSKVTFMGIVVFASLLAASIYALWIFQGAFRASQPPVQAAIIAGIIAVSVSIFTYVTSARAQSLRDIQNEHRKKKAEVYEGFLEALFNMILKNKSEEKNSVEEDMSVFSRKLMIWGSDEVIKKYGEFRIASINGSLVDSVKSLEFMESIFFLMRIDVGHQNKLLIKRDLLRLFINDIDVQ